MRLTILGNSGPYPAPGGACSGYLVESDSGNTRVILDLGTGSLSNLLRFMPVHAITGIVVSHLHFDHMSDLLPMHYALQFDPPSTPLRIYAPQQPESLSKLLKGPTTEVLPNDGCFNIGEMSISCALMRHPLPSSAIRIDCDGASLVYTGDTNTAPNLTTFCQNADILLADAGLSEADYREDAPHLSAALCGQLAKNAVAKRLLLTHLNPKYSPETLLQEARAFFPNAEIAKLLEIYSV